MPQFAAVTWKVKPGYEAELAELFANYKRPDSFIVRDAQGAEVGKVMATAVFMKDDTIVRVIQFEGPLDEVLRHMSRQQGVRELEDAVDKYLVEPRDTTSPEGFRQFFQRSSMRCLVQRFADV
ncbi:hypothetical protein TH66_05420 [Carbonactinospora thermoautotrophica]|uniref:SchA/CurD-like domain-containing protein n=1 Tax=Carbonactinospora thermoautotrophica TaxID=1469144 RepID=A0A132N3D4_9ACTN|nr:SchA/CurD-like domain-containing protein [Carbonactinospora thermoautotrophica]KWX04658.1 hypothetical protein TH66_05420 [Carbonactinospora thermoautotrophica]KWX09523.1 hypothetical protein TR74_09060 [Carbonactinospora thermoautotrophica]